MPSDRSLCLGGGLTTAVNMIRRGFDQRRILERLAERFPEYEPAQFRMCLSLAQRGVLFMDGIDWTDNNAVVDPSKAPRLPAE